eukprot:TRINITY_DN62083_c0_g1_i1.p1 TRINITY_DN62083_c0_g1~~TRINITY_DN62083_c0_g1_i1.p1  ORF type:complete len:570 (+),score=117.47 TRINITY_DN62083_c0_g1_i1:20-1729(+)
MGQQCSELIPFKKASKHRCKAANGSGELKQTLEEKYILGKVFAPKVVAVTHRISSAEYVAYRIQKGPTTCSGLSSQNISTAIGRIHSIDHPNICHLVEAFEDERYVHLVYSKITGRPLFERIAKDGGHSEDKVRSIAYQMLRAINVALKAGVCHGVLASKNLFLTADGRLEITDFGLCGIIKPGLFTEGPCKSMFYLAPEAIKRWLERCKGVKPADMKQVQLEKSQAPKPTEAADVWSMGVIVYTLLAGRTPFKGNHKTGELANNICTGDLKFGHDMEGTLSNEAIRFLSQVLVKSPEKRPTAAELLKHPWLHEERGASQATMSPEICQHLGTIHAESHLKKAMMRIIASRVPPSKIKELERAFDAMDLNRDGMVCLREFKHGLVKNGFAEKMEEEQVNALFHELDHDGCGKIGFREFLAATVDTQRIYVDEVLWDVFERIDKDGNGVVTREELLHAVRSIEGSRLGEEYVSVILSQLEGEVVDALTFEEFRLLVLEEGGRQRMAENWWCPCSILQKGVDRSAIASPLQAATSMLSMFGSQLNIESAEPAPTFRLSVKDKQLLGADSRR